MTTEYVSPQALLDAQEKFDPKKYLMPLQGKEYLEVKWRLVWFRLFCPQGEITTEMVSHDTETEFEEEVMKWNPKTKQKEPVIVRAKGEACFKAIVKDGHGGIATAHKSERACSFPDYREKAETGAVGRALGMLGFGTQFTGDDLNEMHRIVDAPVAVERTQGTSDDERKNGSGNGSTPTPLAPQPSSSSSPSKSTVKATTKPVQQTINDAQLKTIRSLCDQLGKSMMPEGVDFFTREQANTLITELGKELETKQQSIATAAAAAEAPDEEIATLIARTQNPIIGVGRHERLPLGEFIGLPIKPETDLREWEWTPTNRAKLKRIDEYIGSQAQKDWRDGKYTDAQADEVKRLIAIVAASASMKATEAMEKIKERDKEMRGKLLNQCNAGTVDRMIYYLETVHYEKLVGFVFDVPPEFAYNTEKAA